MNWDGLLIVVGWSVSLLVNRLCKKIFNNPINPKIALAKNLMWSMVRGEGG